MCYLCSQRAARNVPVYFREEEELEEKKNTEILVQAQQRKAEEEIQKEQELKSDQRKRNKEVAAFNKGSPCHVPFRLTSLRSCIGDQRKIRRGK